MPASVTPHIVVSKHEFLSLILGNLHKGCLIHWRPLTPATHNLSIHPHSLPQYARKKTVTIETIEPVSITQFISTLPILTIVTGQ